jgi:mono/diheme cytochrome c family protein
MKNLKKIAIGIAALLGLAIVAAVTYAHTAYDKEFQAPYPEIKASTDPEVIARGKYIVFGPGHCSYCHTSKENHQALDEGKEIPLAGGYKINLPLGTYISPNLTPDVETGIGTYSDQELARAIRYGVAKDGRALLPLMEFQHMTDDDLQAVISYLRTQEAVRNPVEKNKLSFMGKAVSAFLIKPVGPNSEPGKTSPKHGETVEKGAYLVNNIAGCAGCHTERNLMDGSFTGPRLAGGMAMEDETNPGFVFVTPNITSDKQTGIGSWSKSQFIERFRHGATFKGTSMPWQAYNRMSDEDLGAIYLYIMSLDPVSKDTKPTLRRAEDVK